MSKIKFSQEWDKLKPENFKVGNIFTTVRKFNKGKFKYYTEKQGELFDVVVKGEVIGKARLLSAYMKKTSWIPVKFIKKDTYSHWGKEEFYQLLRQFYNEIPEYVIILNFEIEEVIK